MPRPRSLARTPAGVVARARGSSLDSLTTPRIVAALLALALEGARPNPTTGALRVWLTLPSREAATLELIDVAGRRVLRRDVGSLGPGAHGVALDAARLRPGLYFIRLAQGASVRRSRVVVVR